MSNKNTYPWLRKPLLVAGVAMLGGLGLAACDATTRKTGHSDEQIKHLVEPEAIKLAMLALRSESSRVMETDNGKSFMVDQGLMGLREFTKPHYEVIINIAKTGTKPDPANIRYISLSHWIVDPRESRKMMIDESIDINRERDGTDQYWTVSRLNTRDNQNDSDDLFVSNRHTDQSEINHVLYVTKTLMDEVQSRYEPGLFPEE